MCTRLRGVQAHICVPAPGGLGQQKRTLSHSGGLKFEVTVLAGLARPWGSEAECVPASPSFWWSPGPSCLIGSGGCSLNSAPSPRGLLPVGPCLRAPRLCDYFFYRDEIYTV